MCGCEGEVTVEKKRENEEKREGRGNMETKGRRGKRKCGNGGRGKVGEGGKEVTWKQREEKEKG